MAQVFPRSRGAQSERITNFASYVMLYLGGLVAMVVAANAISRGLLRALAYAVVLAFLWIITAWIVAGRPGTRALVVTTEGVNWVDQRLHRSSLSREAISRIEQHVFQTSLGRRTGTWLVDDAGQAKVKLMPRIPAREVAGALGVPLVEAEGLVPDQREMERRLPGSGEIASRQAVVTYVVPFGLGFAALALNAVT